MTEQQSPSTSICPRCGTALPYSDAVCPECTPSCDTATQLVRPDRLNETMPLTRQPSPLDQGRRGSEFFSPDAHLILQVLPSGNCIAPQIRSTLILGRGSAHSDDPFLDLNPFNALRQGVSRCHCRIERQGNRLMVIDMDSANGTFLNGAPLVPFRSYPLAHGDRLTLGLLHVNLAFTDA